MELTIERDDNALTASVNGRIDSTNARDFEEAIRTKIEDGDRAVIMDFENLSYISSAGLRAVLMTAKTLWEAGRQVRALLALGPGQGSVRDQRFRQDHPDPRYPRRGDKLTRQLEHFRFARKRSRTLFAHGNRPTAGASARAPLARRAAVAASRASVKAGRSLAPLADGPSARRQSRYLKERSPRLRRAACAPSTCCTC